MSEIIVTYRRLDYFMSKLWGNIERFFAAKTHTHLLEHIQDVDVMADSGAEMLVPIEHDSLTAIARGFFDLSDTSMLTGHPDYVPLSAQKVSELVSVAMTAWHNYSGEE